MKLIKKIFIIFRVFVITPVLSFCVIIGLFMAMPSFSYNAWCLLTCNGYEIPKESSIFTFRQTQDSGGNGDYWSYGEDDDNYYGENKNPKYDPEHDSDYVFLKKGNEPKGFDKFDTDTWGLWEIDNEKK
jgi:hypothetical protein